MTIDGRKVSFWYYLFSAPSDRRRVRELEHTVAAKERDLEYWIKKYDDLLVTALVRDPKTGRIVRAVVK